MLVTTTPIIEGKRIIRYYGIVSGETIIGANVFRDFLAGIRDFVDRRKIRQLERWKNKLPVWEPMPLSVSIWIMKP